MSEFDLIARLRDRLAGIGAGRVDLGIGDDAALWTPAPGGQVVACCDTLIEGRHFPPGTAAADIAWKALAVNLSDLAAMGAGPVAALLALSLPGEPDGAWLEDFCDGWAALAAVHDLALAGGDTTRGPVLALTVTCFGSVPSAQALRRDGARAGDGIYVSGTLGDAAGALALLQEAGEPAAPVLRRRLDRPQPRLALGLALRGLASAAIDVSDGLLADLGHVLRASGVGARIDPARVPLSAELVAQVGPGRALELALHGGDDYELCFTVPVADEARLCAVARVCGLRITRIGDVVADGAGRLSDPEGRPLQVSGWDHFAAGAQT